MFCSFTPKEIVVVAKENKIPDDAIFCGKVSNGVYVFFHKEYWVVMNDGILKTTNLWCALMAIAKTQGDLWIGERET